MQGQFWNQNIWQQWNSSSPNSSCRHWKHSLNAHIYSQAGLSQCVGWHHLQLHTHPGYSLHERKSNFKLTTAAHAVNWLCIIFVHCRMQTKMSLTDFDGFVLAYCRTSSEKRQENHNCVLHVNTLLKWTGCMQLQNLYKMSVWSVGVKQAGSSHGVYGTKEWEKQ